MHNGSDRDDEIETSPLKVDIRTGLGTVLGVVPIAVVSLSSAMNPGQAPFLRDYQAARRVSQNGWFITHLLGPAKSAGQDTPSLSRSRLTRTGRRAKW